MNLWEKELHRIFNSPIHIPHRYELRPGKHNPIIYCSTCARPVKDDASIFVDEIVEECLEHEKNTHSPNAKEKS